MMFFFKKKKLVVDCFIADKTTYELFNVQYAKNFYPDWWKNLESTAPVDAKNKDDPFGNRATMKTCPGIIDYYKNGIIMPMWTDGGFEVGVAGSSYLRVSMSRPDASTIQHSVAQRGTYLPSFAYSHVKINSPWFFKTKRPVQFTMMKPFWNFDRPEELLVPPGTVNFYYQYSTNINMFLKHEKDTKKVIRIEAGTPIMHFIPHTEDKVEIKSHLVSKEELAKVGIVYMFSYVNAYAKYKKMKSKIDNN